VGGDHRQDGASSRVGRPDRILCVSDGPGSAKEVYVVHRTRAGNQAAFALHACVALTFCVFLVLFLARGRTVGPALAPFALFEASVAYYYQHALIENNRS
jgi:hypothetical protein